MSEMYGMVGTFSDLPHFHKRGGELTVGGDTNPCGEKFCSYRWQNESPGHAFVDMGWERLLNKHERNFYNNLAPKVSCCEM